MTRRRGMSLAGQYLLLQLLIVLAVLVGVVAISLAQSAAAFERTEGRRAPGMSWRLLIRSVIAAATVSTKVSLNTGDTFICPDPRAGQFNPTVLDCPYHDYPPPRMVAASARTS